MILVHRPSPVSVSPGTRRTHISNNRSRERERERERGGGRERERERERGGGRERERKRRIRVVPIISAYGELNVTASSRTDQKLDRACGPIALPDRES